MDNLIPLNIGYLTACLKNAGNDVKLFDTTFYRTSEKTSDESRVEALQVKPFDLSEYGIDFKKTDVIDDFRKLISEYKPDLIGFSVVESTYFLSIKLLESIVDINSSGKIIFGGVYAIFAFDRIIEHPMIDMVCSGEGEKTIVEVCRALSEGDSMRHIPNLVFKVDEKIYFPEKTELAELERLPHLDLSLFEKERFYKPMAGKVLKMVPVEFARGCPFNCSYCASPALAQLFSGHGRWFREKRIEDIMREIEAYLKLYQVEYFYFISESLLSMDHASFDRFIDFYEGVRIPFWFNTRIETITYNKLEKLERVNCNRISVGLESGSEDIRRNLLRRYYSNEKFIEKFRIFDSFDISISVNNIIGFPGETREQIFETIELNKRINADSFGAYIFQPYQGTVLREVCVEKGYIKPDHIAGDAHLWPELDMPQITKEEIAGLQRTFALYVTMPKKYYPDIRIAEGFDVEGNKKFTELSELFYKVKR